MQDAAPSLQALHSDELLAVDGRQQANAGIDSSVADPGTIRRQFAQHYGAGTAIPFRAAFLGTSAMGNLAQVLEHGHRGWQSRGADLLAIEQEANIDRCTVGH